MKEARYRQREEFLARRRSPDITAVFVVHGSDEGESPWMTTYSDAQDYGDDRLRSGVWSHYEVEKRYILAVEEP